MADGLTPAMVYAALRCRRFTSRYRERPAEDLCEGVAGQAAVGAEAVRRVLARGLRTLPIGR